MEIYRVSRLPKWTLLKIIEAEAPVNRGPLKESLEKVPLLEVEENAKVPADPEKPLAL
jgi:hypothetical protein